MRFPMIVYKGAESDYCGLLPDFPGIFMAEATLDDLLCSVQDAVETWMAGENPESFPGPSSLDKVASLPEAKGRTLVLAEVNPAFLDNATIRISVSVPRYALGMIDKAAKNAGLKRSAFLVEKALASIR